VSKVEKRLYLCLVNLSDFLRFSNEKSKFAYFANNQPFVSFTHFYKCVICTLYVPHIHKSLIISDGYFLHRGTTDSILRPGLYYR